MNHLILVFTLTLFCSTSLTAKISDWIPDLLSHNACHGYYHHDPFAKIDLRTNFEEPVHIEADNFQADQGGHFSFFGNVDLSQGSLHLWAHEVSLFRDKDTHHLKEMDALGNVILSKPGLKLQGEHLWFEEEPQRVAMGPNEFRWYPRHARGTSQSSVLSENGQLTLIQASYTTCAPEENTWLLKAAKVRLDPVKGRGHAYNTSILINKTPIFYLPYLQFPIDNRRQSGFLSPQIGNKENNGIIIAQPYYLNLAPNYDALLTPRIRTLRGLELQGLFRYLTKNSKGTIEASFLPNDRAFSSFKRTVNFNPQGLGLSDPRIRSLDVSNNRSGIVVHHSNNFNKHWSLQLDINHVHDANYLQDLGSTLSVNDNTYLLQQGLLMYNGPLLKGEVRVQAYETLNPFFGPLNEHLYRRMPMISIAPSSPWQKDSFEFQPSFDWANFQFHGTKLDGSQATVGHRTHVKPTARYVFRTPGVFFIPELSFDLTNYDLSTGTLAQSLGYSDHIQRNVPIYSLDSGLIFERGFKRNKTPWVQTLEPRLFYLYVPYHDQNDIPVFDSGQTTFIMDQLTMPNRFNGIDRIGDTHQISALLSSRWLDGTRWQERFRASFGQIYYFQKRRVSLCDNRADPNCLGKEDPRYTENTSPLLAEFRYQLDNSWSWESNVSWYSRQLDSAGLRLRYRAQNGGVFNLGYAHVLNPLPILPSPNLVAARPGSLEQSEISVSFPWHDQWQILGRWHYDWREHLHLVSTAGLEYSGCCVSLQLSFSRTVQLTRLDTPQRYTHSFNIQFGLKGLGALGNSPNKRLKEQIPGYKSLIQS